MGWIKIAQFDGAPHGPNLVRFFLARAQILLTQRGRSFDSKPKTRFITRRPHPPIPKSAIPLLQAKIRRRFRVLERARGSHGQLPRAATVPRGKMRASWCSLKSGFVGVLCYCCFITSHVLVYLGVRTCNVIVEREHRFLRFWCTCM